MRADRGSGKTVAMRGERMVSVFTTSACLTDRDARRIAQNHAAEHGLTIGNRSSVKRWPGRAELRRFDYPILARV